MGEQTTALFPSQRPILTAILSSLYFGGLWEAAAWNQARVCATSIPSSCPPPEQTSSSLCGRHLRQAAGTGGPQFSLMLQHLQHLHLWLTIWTLTHVAVHQDIEYNHRRHQVNDSGFERLPAIATSKLIQEKASRMSKILQTILLPGKSSQWNDWHSYTTSHRN